MCSIENASECVSKKGDECKNVKKKLACQFLRILSKMERVRRKESIARSNGAKRSHAFLGVGRPYGQI